MIFLSRLRFKTCLIIREITHALVCDASGGACTVVLLSGLLATKCVRGTMASLISCFITSQVLRNYD